MQTELPNLETFCMLVRKIIKTKKTRKIIKTRNKNQQTPNKNKNKNKTNTNPNKITKVK